MAVAERRRYLPFMLRRTASLLPRPLLAALAVVLGLQIAASGFASSDASSREAQLAGHATAIIPSLPATTHSLEVENYDAGASRTASPARVDVRPHPTSDGRRGATLTPWRTDDALARAGRLSAPSTAPPLSGA